MTVAAREEQATGRLSAFHVVLALLGAFLLYLSIPNAGVVMRSARAGEGLQGTFTARHLNCVQHPGHTACDWQGEFRSADGTVTRPSVFLYGGAGELAVGSTTKARDVGRTGEVYRPNGTHEWIPTALLALSGLALLVFALPYRLARSWIAHKRHAI